MIASKVGPSPQAGDAVLPVLLAGGVFAEGSTRVAMPILGTSRDSQQRARELLPPTRRHKEHACISKGFDNVVPCVMQWATTAAVLLRTPAVWAVGEVYKRSGIGATKRSSTKRGEIFTCSSAFIRSFALLLFALSVFPPVLYAADLSRVAPVV